MESNKYSNGKIYKVIDNAYTKCYIGSTCEDLSQRLARHRLSYRRYKNGLAPLCKIFDLFDEFGVDDCKILLIENYPCDSVEQLRRQEGKHIQEHECVNRNVAGRTKQEYKKDYYQRNKEALQEEHKQYKEKNKDKIVETQKQYYLKHQEQKLEYANEYRAKNKELINEKLREKVLCDVCQCMVSKRNISTHYSCKKHLDNLASTTI